MGLNANVRLYGPTIASPGASPYPEVALVRDAASVTITNVEWVAGRLCVYLDLNDPEAGSAVDLKGSPADFRALAASLAAAIDEAEMVPEADR